MGEIGKGALQGKFDRQLEKIWLTFSQYIVTPVKTAYVTIGSSKF